MSGGFGHGSKVNKRKQSSSNGAGSGTESNLKVKTGSKNLMMRKDDGVTNQSIGPIVSDPSTFGFQKRNYKRREIPRFLIGQHPQLKPRKFKQDPWDQLNQEKMSDLENKIDDLTELYETLKKMRDNERKVMEKKGLVDKADLAKDLNDAIVFQGTCQDMCPIFERARRNVEYTVYSYEKIDPSGKKASVSKALKVFARPAAAAAPPLPSDVRPPHVLVKTLDYLVDNLLTTLPDSESFIWDRMRSIRQDFTYQNYSGPEAIDCNERIVRIHLLIIHVMVKSGNAFSLQQELEQLHKSLITLSEIYDDVRNAGGSCPNEAEFRAYGLLSKIRDPEYEKNIQELPKEIFQNSLVQLALCFRKFISNSGFSERGFIRTESCLNFYTKYFQLMKSGYVPFLMNSFLEIYINEVRFYAMKSISHTLNKKSKPLPINNIKDLLSFNSNDEIKAFCDYYSIDIINNGVDLKSLTHHSHRIPESKPMKQSYLDYVDHQLTEQTYQSIINCGLPNIDTLPSSKDDIYSQTPFHELSNDDDYDDGTFVEGDIDIERAIHIDEQIISPNKSYITHINEDRQNLKSALTSPKKNSLLEEKLKALRKQGGNNFKLPITNQVKQSSPPKTNDNKPLSKRIDISSSFDDKISDVFNHGPAFNYESKNQDNLISEEVKEKDFENQLNEKKKKPIHLDNKQTNLSNTIVTESSEPFKMKPIISPSKPEGFFEQPFNKNTIDVPKTGFGTSQKNLDLESNIPLVTTNPTFIPNNTESSDSIKKNIIEEAKTKLISNIANELYHAFINEQFYLVCNETKAEVHYIKNLKARYILKWKKFVAQKEKNKKKLEERREELKLVNNRLGVPLLRKTNTSLLSTPTLCNISSSSFRIPSSTLKNVIVSPVNNETSSFNDVNSKVTSSNLWKPFDIETLYFIPLLKHNLEIKLKTFSILLYHHNENSITTRWILKKFGLDDNSVSRSIRHNRSILTINSVNLSARPSTYHDTQLLVFNAGVTDSNIFDLEIKLKQDGEDLIKLVSEISVITNIKFSILIIYWESLETKFDDTSISKYLKLPRIARSFESVISDVVVTRISNSKPEDSLTKGLTEILNKYSFEYTEKGIHTHRHPAPTRSIAGILSTGENNDLIHTKNIDAKMKKMLEYEREKFESEKSKNNTYAHLQIHLAASPKMRKRKLPVLLSEAKSGKFRTPSAPTIDSRASSPRVSSHLAMKFRKTQRIVSVPDVIAPGTPTYINNLPTSSLPLTLTPTAASTSTHPRSFNRIVSTSNQMNEHPIRQDPRTDIVSTTPIYRKILPPKHSNDLTSIPTSTTAPNITTIRNVTPHQEVFHISIQTPSTTSTSARISSLHDLKSLIDSVKKRVNHD